MTGLLNPLLRPVLGPVLGSISRAGVATQRRIIEKFASLTGWTVANGTGVAASLSSGDGVLSPNCIRLASDAGASGNASITEDLATPLDLSAENGFWLRVRVNFRQTASQIGLTVYLSQLTGLASPGRWSAVNAVSSFSVSDQPHWIPKSKFSVLDGTPSFSNPVKSWRFRIDAGSEQHDYELLGAWTSERSRPCVVITNDDGWYTAYSVAYAEASTRNIPLTFYLIASTLGTAGYMTLAQAQEVQDAGHTLGLHGVNDWNTISNITSDVAALQALGLPTDHGAYPQGVIGDGTTWTATKNALISAGVKTSRLAGGNEPVLRNVGDPYCLLSYSLSSSTTLAQAKAAVDTAIESGGTVFFYGHKYGATADSLTWVTSDFTALLDYIVAKRDAGLLDTKTVAQWWGA